MRGAICLGLVAFAFFANGQQIKTARSLYLRETEEREGLREYYSTFPNLDLPGRFLDKKLLAEIGDVEARKDYRSLDLLLTAYVRNFAIGNFRQDQELPLIWKLGQLSELRRDTAKALYYYAIALRNQSRATPQVKLAYDTLRSPYRNDFVDLDYYYELVSARRKVDTLVPPKGVLLNMGDRINSPAPDYGPYMHPSGSLLLFTSRRGTFEEFAPTFDQREDIYFAQASLFGEGWEDAQRFGDAINSPFNEGSACLNTEATELYFTRCNAPGTLGVCDIYMAQFKDGKWVNVVNLGPNVNSGDWDSHPHVSPDGKWLYFASNRSGGFGRTDLYRCPRGSDGKWGPAENLGPTINSIDDEVTPFLHPINRTLYFSSRGHLNNFGGFDIYKARWKLNHWSEPQNLGPLVNTRGDEYYFSIDGKGENLFYAAARRESPSNLDLYSFPMPMNARPDAVVKLKGYLVDSISGMAVTGIITAVDQDKGTEVAPIYTSRTGYFEFDLIGNRKYALVILGNNAVTIRENVPLTEDTLVKIFTRNLEVGRPIVFETMQFKRNSADIEPQTLPKLKLLGEFLKRYPNVRLTIRGHTDADGDADYNLQLSQERSENIRQYLLSVSQQPDTLIRAEGYGESRPIYPNDLPEHKMVNRRVEFELTIPEVYRGKLGAETVVFDDRTPARLEERVEEEAEDEIEGPPMEDEAAADDLLMGLEDEDLDDLTGMLGDMLDELDDDQAAKDSTATPESGVGLGKPGDKTKPGDKANPDKAKPTDKLDPKDPKALAKPDPKAPAKKEPPKKEDDDDELDDEDEDDEDGGGLLRYG